MSVTTEPWRPAARISAIRPKEPHRFVPVEPPTRRPRTTDPARIAASDAASGTATIRSTTAGWNDGSTRGRPIPSIRDPRPVTMLQSMDRYAGQNAELSGSTTHSFVAYRRKRADRPIVALVPPV